MGKMRAVLLVITACGRIGFGPGGGIVVVQTTQNFDKNVIANVTLNPLVAGDLVVVATANIDDGMPLVAIDDNAGNTYVATAAHYSCALVDPTAQEFWYAVVDHPGATALSLSSATAVRREVWVIELAGATSADATAVATNVTGTTSGSAPPVTPTRVPAIVNSEINAPVTASPLLPGPFVAQPDLNGDDVAYAIVDAPGSYGAAWALTVGGPYCASTVAFVQ
jgi:hypothetical protein